jgi:uncharacterized membrane protein
MDMQTAQLTSAGWIILGVGVVIAAAGFVWAVSPPGETRIARWSSHHGLGLTESNRAVIAAYLRRTRALQFLGAGLGWVSSPVYIGLVGRPFPLGDSWVMLAVAGYLVGAAVAEVVCLGRPRPRATVRAAALAPRTLFDYVPAASVWTIRVLPFATVILAVVYAIAPKNPQRGVDPSVAFVVAAAIVVVAFAALTEWFSRIIVLRPQPAITDDLLAADDAIRAGSIHSLSAAAVALILLSLGWTLLSLAGVTVNPQLGAIVSGLGVACDLGALIAWIVLGHVTNWQVRRGASLVSG